MSSETNKEQDLEWLPWRFFANPAFPLWFRAVVLFGLPWVWLAGVAAAIWLVWHYTDLVAAVDIVLLAQIFAVGLIAVARRKLELKELLVFILILGSPLPLFLFGAWLFGGY